MELTARTRPLTRADDTAQQVVRHLHLVLLPHQQLLRHRRHARADADLHQGRVRLRGFAQLRHDSPAVALRFVVFGKGRFLPKNFRGPLLV